MKRLLLIAAASCALAACGGEAGNDTAEPAAANAASPAQSGNLLQALGDSRFHQLVRTAGMEPTLSGSAPYTLLVPADDVLAKLPPERLQSLQQPANRQQLTQLLAAHMLPGTMTLDDIRKGIERGGGKVMLATFGGQMLTATADGPRILLTGPDGQRASLSGDERILSNGVIHPVDAVIAPAS